jgi:hypothetical protein
MIAFSNLIPTKKDRSFPFHLQKMIAFSNLIPTKKDRSFPFHLQKMIAFSNLIPTKKDRSFPLQPPKRSKFSPSPYKIAVFSFTSQKRSPLSPSLPNNRRLQFHSYKKRSLFKFDEKAIAIPSRLQHIES